MKRAALLNAWHEDPPPCPESHATIGGALSPGGRAPDGATDLPARRLSGALARLRPLDIRLLALAAEGLNDKAIARELGSWAPAVHHRWRMIREALKARDRAHAVAIALTLKLIPPPQRALEMLAEHGDGDVEKVINIPAPEISAFASRPT